MSRRPPQEVDRTYPRVIAKRPHVTVDAAEEARIRAALAAGFDGVVPMSRAEHLVRVIRRGACYMSRQPLDMWCDGQDPACTRYTTAQRAALDEVLRYFLDSPHFT